MPAATIRIGQPLGTISPLLYGHFAEHLGACVEEGIWVGEDSPIANVNGIRRDVIDALRALRVPVLRWPGGCFADDYHWEDGIGPRSERPRRVNIWWGQNIETNAFGTHEFIELCRQIGAAPYLAGNVGSGSPREMREWVEYCNFAGDSTLSRRRAANGSAHPFHVRFWGVGNEAWGCGGNFCPEDYAALYKRFATFLPDLSGTKLFLIACGPNSNDLDWTRRFLKKLGTAAPYWNRRLHGLAAHYYTWNSDGRFGTATAFSADQFYALLRESCRAEELIIQQRQAMNELDPQQQIGLLIDEWGTWHPPTPGRNPSHLWQQNTLRDALSAALTLNIFNRHADKLVMANIAQLANVLQAMILTEGEKIVLTPTYHVFQMYQSHQGAGSLSVAIESPEITFAAGEQAARLPHLSASASQAGNGLTLSVVNPHVNLPIEATIEPGADRTPRSVKITTLQRDDPAAHNTFDDPQAVAPQTAQLEPSSPWRHVFPPASVTVMRVNIG